MRQVVIKRDVDGQLIAFDEKSGEPLRAQSQVTITQEPHDVTRVTVEFLAPGPGRANDGVKIEGDG